MSEKQSKSATNHLSQYGGSNLPASIADPSLKFVQEQEDLQRQMLASAKGADFGRQAQAQAEHERMRANAIGDFGLVSIAGRKPPYGVDSIVAGVHENFRREAGRVEVAAFNAAGLDSSNLVSRSFGQTHVLTEEIDLIRQQLSTIGLAKISDSNQSKFGSPRLSVKSKSELQPYVPIIPETLFTSS